MSGRPYSDLDQEKRMSHDEEKELLGAHDDMSVDERPQTFWRSSSKSVNHHRPARLPFARSKALPLAALMLFVAGALVFSAACSTGLLPTSRFGPQQTGEDAVMPISESELFEQAPKRKFWLRTGIKREGVGSAMQRFKESIVLSEALGRRFFLTEADFGFAREDLFNKPYADELASVDMSSTCDIWRYITSDERTQLAEAICNVSTPDYEQARVDLTSLAQRLDNCSVVIDSQRELHENLNGCVQPWIRETLGYVPATTFDPKRVSVGIHIRNPQMGYNDTTATLFRGSMKPSTINKILRDIKAKFGAENLDVTIAMAEHRDDVLAEIEVDDYKLLDSHSDHIGDLKGLGDNDILLVGGSSYAALGQLLARPGLTIADGSRDVKFRDAQGYGRKFVPYKDYTPDILDDLPSFVSGDWQGRPEPVRLRDALLPYTMEADETV